MDDTICVCACKVFPRQSLEVLGAHQHAHADEVIMQEVVERGKARVAVKECIGGSKGRIFLRRRQGDAITSGQG